MIPSVVQDENVQWDDNNASLRCVMGDVIKHLESITHGLKSQAMLLGMAKTFFGKTKTQHEQLNFNHFVTCVRTMPLVLNRTKW